MQTVVFVLVLVVMVIFHLPGEAHDSECHPLLFTPICPTDHYIVMCDFLQLTCTDCDANWYKPADIKDLEGCYQCSNGYHRPSNAYWGACCPDNYWYVHASDSCYACGDGQELNTVTGQCTTCAAGKYKQGVGYHECLNCGSSTYSSAGASSCEYCPYPTDGTSCTQPPDPPETCDENFFYVDHCIACGKFGAFGDFYNFVELHDTCATCDLGKHMVVEDGIKTCKTCPPGHYKDSYGYEGCILCLAGTKPDSLSSSCDACNYPSTVNADQTACVCLDGYAFNQWGECIYCDVVNEGFCVGPCIEPAIPNADRTKCVTPPCPDGYAYDENMDCIDCLSTDGFSCISYTGPRCTGCAEGSCKVIYNQTSTFTDGPDNYDDWADCRYIQIWPDALSYTVRKTNGTVFDIENGYDFLNIYGCSAWDATQLADSRCQNQSEICSWTGSTTPLPCVVGYPVVYLRFQSDHIGTRSGFSVDIEMSYDTRATRPPTPPPTPAPPGAPTPPPSTPSPTPQPDLPPPIQYLCPPGTGSVPGNPDSCFQCPVGKYSNDETIVNGFERSCEWCPQGQYTFLPGSTACSELVPVENVEVCKNELSKSEKCPADHFLGTCYVKRAWCCSLEGCYECGNGAVLEAQAICYPCKQDYYMYEGNLESDCVYLPKPQGCIKYHEYFPESYKNSTCGRGHYLSNCLMDTAQMWLVLTIPSDPFQPIRVELIPNSAQAVCEPCPKNSIIPYDPSAPLAGGPNHHLMQCVQCPEGTYTEYNQLMDECCALGYTWYGQSIPGESRQYCKACGNGQSSDEIELNCYDCPIGKYNDITGGVCKDCPSGKYSWVNGSHTCCDNNQIYDLTTNACEYCMNGKFRQDGFPFYCVDCRAGSYKPPGDDYCRFCPVGTYQPSGGQTYCIDCPPTLVGGETGLKNLENCSECAAGFYLDVSLGKCTACRPGFYTNIPNQTECIQCPAGYKPVDVFGANFSGACSLCEPGKYFEYKIVRYFTGPVNGTCTPCTDISSQPSCVKCAAGYGIVDYVDNQQISEDACAICPTGKYSDGTGFACVDCPVGTYNGVVGQTFCVSCPYNYIGTYTRQTSFETACNPLAECGFGDYSTTRIDLYNYCEVCPEGTYKNKASHYDTECDPCPAGTIAPYERNPICCSDQGGLKKSLVGSTYACTPCTAGYYALPGTLSSTCQVR